MKQSSMIILICSFYSHHPFCKHQLRWLRKPNLAHLDPSFFHNRQTFVCIKKPQIFTGFASLFKSARPPRFFQNNVAEIQAWDLNFDFNGDISRTIAPWRKSIEPTEKALICGAMKDFFL
jgi:hypothetical protein